MSAIGEALAALRGALALADDVRRVGGTLKELTLEVREHDRRLTRLEAQWDTALALSRRPDKDGRAAPLQLAGRRRAKPGGEGGPAG